MHIDRNEFARLVAQALRDIPDTMQKHLRDVSIDVQSHPDAQACREADIDDPRELLGFYRGTPLTERSPEDIGPVENRITIYQRNIERYCRTREEILDQIRVTVLHEVGHHFGLDEDQLADLGYD